ncbi:MAG: ABC transporter substrate-binding protein, partial [Oscillospiraceae bacterium]
MKRWALAVALLLAVFALSACSAKAPEKKEIAFADVGWDSIRYANAIAGLVAEEVYGYDWREVSGSTPITHEALKKGEVDVHMEIWTANLPSYQKDLDENQFVELGVNFDDNAQGFYIPRYLIYGDASRGIAPLAPDLKYVWQLKDYARLFSDDERANRGRIYGGIPGWEIDDIMYKKFLHYGLNDCYEYVRPGTDAAMSAALVSAYDKGLPIVAYYWEPTWILGKYDFILLEDEPYEPVGFKNGETTCPSVRVTTGVSNEFYKDNPEFCEFLSKYRSSSKTISKALAYMEDQNADYEQTARWFLQENPQLIDEWLSPENAKTLKAALNDEDKSKKNPLLDFP